MDYFSVQEVIRSLISFTEKGHDKGSKEAQQTMIEFSKYKNKHKEGMFENDTVWKSVKELSPGPGVVQNVRKVVVRALFSSPLLHSHHRVTVTTLPCVSDTYLIPINPSSRTSYRRYSVNTYTAKTTTSVFAMYTHLKPNRLRSFT